MRLMWAIPECNANRTTIELNCYNSMNEGPKVWLLGVKFNKACHFGRLAAAMAKRGPQSHSSVTAVTPQG